MASLELNSAFTSAFTSIILLCNNKFLTYLYDWVAVDKEVGLTASLLSKTWSILNDFPLFIPSSTAILKSVAVPPIFAKATPDPPSKTVSKSLNLCDIGFCTPKRITSFELISIFELFKLTFVVYPDPDPITLNPTAFPSKVTLELSAFICPLFSV